MINIEEVTIQLTPISTILLILALCCYLYIRRRIPDTKRDDTLTTLINIILKLFS